jgi:predicted DNA-binding transcriptional regulator AlpA
MTDSPFITIKEMAQFLGTSTGSIRTMLCRDPGQLPPRFSGPGKRIVWHRDDVEEWVKQKRKTAKARVLGQQPRVGSIRLVGSRPTYAR